MALLAKLSTVAPPALNKDKIKEETKKLICDIQDYQKKLFAEQKKGLLIILQGLDASGKDGLITKVLSGMNPLGTEVCAFKAPTEEERSYDFLWRVHNVVPPKGVIHVFNRSHYEDVLVPRVENWIDLKTVKKRYQHINNFESLLTDNDTVIVKFYLHISKKEQKTRLLERKTNPEKFWKHNDGDWETSKKWNKYMEAYEDIFKQCNTVPWNIIPADQNWYKEYLVAKKVKEAMAKINPKFPGLNSKS